MCRVPVSSLTPRHTLQTQAGCEGSPRTMSLQNFMLFFPLPEEALPMTFTMLNKKAFFSPLDIFISPLKDVQ